MTISEIPGSVEEKAPPVSLIPNSKWYVIHTYSGYEKR
jgi:hypothetical protein